MSLAFLEGCQTRKTPKQQKRGSPKDGIRRKLDRQAELARLDKVAPLKSDPKTRRWYAEDPSGYWITVRYGNEIMQLPNGDDGFSRDKTLDSVIELIADLKDALRDGHFDAEIQRISLGFARRSAGRNKNVTTKTEGSSSTGGNKKVGNSTP